MCFYSSKDVFYYFFLFLTFEIESLHFSLIPKFLGLRNSLKVTREKTLVFSNFSNA